MSGSIRDVPVTKDGHLHTPPYIKPTEMFTLYNPFFYDLIATRLTINPYWDEQPGITLNWLYVTGRHAERLLFGIEAETVDDLLVFLERFQIDHTLTRRDAARLVMLGHPTLAYRGTKAPADSMWSDPAASGRFVGSLNNYSGQVGGELRHKNGAWWINDRSGRYKAGLLAHSRPTTRSAYLTHVKHLFHTYAGIEVGVER